MEDMNGSVNALCVEEGVIKSRTRKKVYILIVLEQMEDSLSCDIIINLKVKE